MGTLIRELSPPPLLKEGEEDKIIDYSVFKDNTGRYRTRSLFREYEVKGYEALFTLASEDKDGYISLKRKYLEIADPTEYKFSLSVFGPNGWEHWTKLKGLAFLKPSVERWREELDVLLSSQVTSGMQKAAKGGSVPALKWLADKGWSTKPAPSKKGRPTKEEVERELKAALRTQDYLDEDAERLGLGK